VLGSAGQFAYGVNAYGGPSQNPYRDALLSLFAPTPEQQFAEAYAGRHRGSVAADVSQDAGQYGAPVPDRARLSAQGEPCRARESCEA
jgi:hypothetical protein